MDLHDHILRIKELVELELLKSPPKEIRSSLISLGGKDTSSFKGCVRNITMCGWVFHSKRSMIFFFPEPTSECG